MTDVEKYINGTPEWAKEKLQIFHKLLVGEGLNPTLKWGAPMYAGNKNVVGLAAFKNHVSIWFHQGVFLKDEAHVLVAGGENTKGLRQWRFATTDVVDENLVSLYIKESVENDAKGLKIEKAKTEIAKMPAILAEALGKRKDLMSYFGGLTISQKNEFFEHITSAKREETQLRRAEMVLQLLENKQGLNDKYKK